MSHFSAPIVNQPIKGNKRSVFVAYLRSEKVTKVAAVFHGWKEPVVG